MNRRWLAAGLVGLAAVILLLWLARAFIATRLTQAYFAEHGIESAVEIGALGLSGVSARFALGPAAAPDIAADRIELRFDPLRWTPTVVEVRLVKPVVRARLDANGHLTLGSLQNWINSLGSSQGKSRFVSDDLAVSLTGLRLLLATPGGALEADGDIRLVKNLPASLDLSLRPTTLIWCGVTARLTAGNLAYENALGRVTLHLAGDVEGGGVVLRSLDARLKAAALRWSTANGISITVPSADLTLSAAGLNGARAATLAATIAQFRFASSPLAASADVRFTGGVSGGAAIPVIHTGEARLDRALAANLARLNLDGAARLALRDGRAEISLARPLQLRGASGANLTLQDLRLAGTADGGGGIVRATLRGGGLPSLTMTADPMTWRGGALTAQTQLSAQFDYAMLRRVNLTGRGGLSWQAGRYTFAPGDCLSIRMAAFHPGASDLARNLRGRICAASGKPLIAGEGAQWKLLGEARNAAADLPLAKARAENVTARLDFEGKGAPLKGTATVTAATLSDIAPSLRFHPLRARGNATLAGGVWRGKFTLADGKHNTTLGQASFRHVMASGAGTARITAPHIAFAVGKLQPTDLSPLLVALRRADGSVGFAGDVSWTRAALTSKGTLSIPALNFMTPLGQAHAVKSQIVFTSLLPPVTAPGQTLAIARIDWTLPLTTVQLRFAASPSALAVAGAATGIAQGRVTLGAINVNLAEPGKIAGTAQLAGIALGDLVTASNLSSKLKLTGKVSGTIPFTAGPDGFHIAGGHIASDGPGRLSVNRSLWTQGAAALSSNAVQDFAYQALENLAFDQMTADLNSVTGGRLQIVFHIKGHSDPPTRQTADVAIADIINGTALYKPIPLPSGTPIDLTLDTSLNFDELLKSYTEAWSKTLSPEADAKSVEPKP